MNEPDALDLPSKRTNNGRVSTDTNIGTATNRTSSDIPLIAYLGTMWKRKYLILAITLAMGLPAYFVAAAQIPVYQSSAKLMLTQDLFDSNYNVTSKDLTEVQLSSQIALLTSPEVSARAVELGAASEVKATAAAKSNIVTITATDTDRARVVATVNAYIQAFTQYGQARNRSALANASTQLQARIDQFQHAINTALPQDRGILQQQQLRFMDQVTRLEIQRGLTASSAQIVRPAELPTAPIRPTPARDGMLALVIGLVLGISIAVLVETLRGRRIAMSTQAAPGSDQKLLFQ